MDKRQNRSIIIKINGKTSFVKEHTSENHQNQLKDADKCKACAPREKKHSVAKSGEKEDPEKIKEDAASQTAAAQEEPFRWILPENTGEQEFIAPVKKNKSAKTVLRKRPLQLKSLFKHHSSGKRSILSALFIILVAVLVGTAFGLTMLHMVTSEKQGTGTVSEPVFKETHENGNTGKFLDITVYVIQGGVFSTEEAAENSVNSLWEKGAPAGMIKMEDRYFVFIGIADNMDRAKKLGNYFAGKGIDSYAKEIIFYIDEHNSLKNEEIAFLQEALALINRLASVSATGIMTGNVSEDTNQPLSEQVNRWNKINGHPISRAELKEMKRELEQAVKKWSSLKDGGENLISIQQHLLNSLAFLQKLS